MQEEQHHEHLEDRASPEKHDDERAEQSAWILTSQALFSTEAPPNRSNETPEEEGGTDSPPPRKESSEPLQDGAGHLIEIRAMIFDPPRPRR